MKIDISNQGEMAFPREKGLSAAPGFATSIGMRKVIFQLLSYFGIVLKRIPRNLKEDCLRELKQVSLIPDSL